MQKKIQKMIEINPKMKPIY